MSKIIQLIICKEKCVYQQECQYHVNGDSAFDAPHDLLFVETRYGDQALQCIKYNEYKE